jgi:hypothetical protein
MNDTKYLIKKKVYDYCTSQMCNKIYGKINRHVYNDMCHQTEKKIFDQVMIQMVGIVAENIKL